MRRQERGGISRDTILCRYELYSAIEDTNLPLGSILSASGASSCGRMLFGLPLVSSTPSLVPASGVVIRATVHVSGKIHQPLMSSDAP